MVQQVEKRDFPSSQESVPDFFLPVKAGITLLAMLVLEGKRQADRLLT